jgi:L,D-transpeptidase YcbB
MRIPLNIKKIFFTHSLLVLGLFLFYPTTGLSDSFALINRELLKELSGFPEKPIGIDWCNVDEAKQEQWVSAVYQELGMHPLWVNANGPTEQAKLALSTLKSVGDDGLNPENYGIVPIESKWTNHSAASLARLDIEITIGLLGYIHDMQEGRLVPNQQNSKLFDQAGCPSFDPVNALFSARNNEDLEAYLAGLAPSHRYYRALKQELKHYRDIADKGGWPIIPAGKTLHPKESDTRVPDLRRLLIITGDLVTDIELSNQIYDDGLFAAVRKFQLRHGLDVDGFVGKDTTEALNVPIEKRIHDILINMERWRWTEHDLGTKYVLVDIAGFNLQGAVKDIPLLEMAIIVGKLHHETPVFSDTIKYLEFNPFWNITTSIATNEMLPELRKDSNHLANKHIKLFSSWKDDAVELDPQNINWNQMSKKQMAVFKLRQEPGIWNALGVVKFVFPNKYSIYMHDTPVHSLFKKSNRAFSHGCIRLSEPKHLAEFILKDNDAGWTGEAIQKVIKSEKRTVVKLHKPIPVHLVYKTAWVDKNGLLHFSKDLYGRDRKLSNALFGEQNQ